MTSFASPNITLEQWHRGEKTDVDVFEDQYRCWILDQARILARGEHAGPAMLGLLTPLFEALAQYRSGVPSKGHETDCLRSGLHMIFPDIGDAARESYLVQVRHGLAHEAMFRRVRLHRGRPSFDLVDDTLTIDPWWVLQRSEDFFASYVGALRRNDPEVVPPFRAFMEIRKRR